ncbi:hypothetical protein V501_02089 [Pseudogymnoascus sp. VKM F-4519 (FW-2642)]|nr:hypothetical protein V501_02089 [Pseudogymnoascus sp. VKM F-4519 (FW-2642)]
MSKGNASSAPGDLTQGAPPPRKRAARQRAPPKLTPLLYKASIKKLAENSISSVNSSTAKADSAMLKRIKSCLDRANHPGTPESEAKTALCMASRLMARYNVSQAEVLAHEPESTQKQYGGQSEVQLLRSDGDKSKSIRHQNYVKTLCWAMTTFFDCKSFSTRYRSSLVLTFYGIAENTVAAALGFEMVFNLAGEWARPYKGIGRKNSYSLGVCEEMFRMAKQKKKDELAEAKKAEEEATEAKVRQDEAERQAHLDRLNQCSLSPSNYSSPESGANTSDTSDAGSSQSPSQWNTSGFPVVGYGLDDEDSDFDMDGYFSDDCTEPDFEVQDRDSDTCWDQEDQNGKSENAGIFASNTLTASAPHSGLLEPKSPASSLGVAIETAGATANLEVEPQNKWASQMQLQLFRETALKIADEYLKECDIKLGKSKRGRVNVIRDRDAYNQGAKDSTKIDLDRKRITESGVSDV